MPKSLGIKFNHYFNYSRTRLWVHWAYTWYVRHTPLHERIGDDPYVYWATHAYVGCTQARGKPEFIGFAPYLSSLSPSSSSPYQPPLPLDSYLETLIHFSLKFELVCVLGVCGT